MEVSVALEWFKNPDHLPFIAGIELGWFAQAGLDVRLIEPEAHYDGLAAAQRGELAFACNEPLHMMDEPRPGLKALGCFFETDGGILLKPSAGERLLAGETVRLASPVAGEATDAIALEILRRWCRQRGAEMRPEQVQIEAAGFAHIANLQAGFDGAWLCFYNFEGVEAEHSGLAADFIATKSVGMQNFSALELFTGADFLRQQPQVVAQFCAVVSRGAAACQADVGLAKQLWYQHSQTQPDAMMDAIIADTCSRLISPLERSSQRWQALFAQFQDLGLSAIDEAAYAALYA